MASFETLQNAVLNNELIESNDWDGEKTPSCASLEFDDRLIVAVFENPVLWDMSRSDYKNLVKKDAVWRTIGAALDGTGEHCRLRWRTLRERYSREIRKAKQTSLSGSAGNSRVWAHMESMGFLKMQIKPRMKNKNNAPREMQHMSDLECLMPSPPSLSQEDSASSSHGSFQSPAIQTETTSKRKRNYSTNHIVYLSPEYIGDSIVNELQSTKDVMEKFGNSIQQRTAVSSPFPKCRRIRTLCELIEDRYAALPIEKKNDFDIAVLQLLQETERQ